MAKPWGSPTRRVNVQIDDDGFIRREEMTYSFTDGGGENVRARALREFLDVGRPQAIAFPDDGEVVDVSDHRAGYVRGPSARPG